MNGHLWSQMLDQDGEKVEAEVVSVLSQGRQLPSHQQAKQPLVDSLLLFMYLWNI